MAKMFDTYIEGLDEVFRGLNNFGKEASKELRQASKVIAENHMVPAWKDAANNYAGPWGPDIADSVRAGADRVPKIMIGNQKKTVGDHGAGRRGNATSNMVRFPSDSGNAGNSFAPFVKTNWIAKTRSYQPAALKEWSQAIDRVVIKWSVL
jgi:hypothetical protein